MFRIQNESLSEPWPVSGYDICSLTSTPLLPATKLMILWDTECQQAICGDRVWKINQVDRIMASVVAALC